MQMDVRGLVAELALAVLTANGSVSHAERGSLERLDQLGFGSVSDLCEVELRRAATATRSPRWQGACAKLASLDAELRAAIVKALAEIAASDDQICTREIEVVDRIAVLLGLPPIHAVSCLNVAITSRAERRSRLKGGTLS